MAQSGTNTKSAGADAGAKQRPAATSIAGVIVAITLTTILGGGAGVAYALRTEKNRPAENAGKSPDPRVEAKAAAVAPGSMLREIPPVVANLAFPPETWVRIEASVMLDAMASEQADLLIAEIAQDTLAFVRNLSLPQLQGPAGLQNLREDIGERISIRSKGKARDVFLRSLVLQ